jgi:hypothetical protein
MFKKIIIGLLLALPAFAADVPERQELPAVNMLAKKNPGFENGKASWSVSGGSLSTATSGANFYTGAASGVFTASGSGQILSSALVPVLNAPNGSASCKVKTAASDFVLQVFDGTNVLAESTIGSSTSFKTAVATFPMPATGSIRLRVKSASAAAIALDNCVIGENKLIQLSQAQHYGSMSVTNCTGVTSWTTGAYHDQDSGGTACTYTATGKLSAPVGAFMGFRTAFEPGEYLITTGNASELSASAVILGTRISNGTVSTKSPTKQLGGSAVSANSGDTYSLTVTSPLSASDFKFQVNVAAGTYSSDTSGANEFTFDVYKFPTQVDQAYTAGTIAQDWSGNVTGNTGITSATPVDLPGTPTLTEYSNTNAGTVTISAASNGFTISPARAGTVEVCHSGTGNFSNASASATIGTYKNSVLMDAVLGITNSTAGGSLPFGRCLQTKVTSVGSPLEFKIEASINSGTFSVGDVLWTFKYLDQQVPAPVLVGSVISPIAGVEILARASVAGAGGPNTACVTSPCTVHSQSGSWITSVTRTSAGVYVVNFASGTFSASPMCQVTASDVSTAISASLVNTATSSLVGVAVWNGVGANADDAFQILCMGPK